MNAPTCLTNPLQDPTVNVARFGQTLPAAPEVALSPRQLAERLDQAVTELKDYLLYHELLSGLVQHDDELLFQIRHPGGQTIGMDLASLPSQERNWLLQRLGQLSLAGAEDSLAEVSHHVDRLRSLFTPAGAT